MKRTLLLLISAALLGACSSATPVVTNQQTDGAQNPSSSTGSETVAAHSADGRIKPAGVNEQSAPGGEKTGWSRSGNPIDTSSYDAEIKSAEAKVKASPSNDAAKKELSQAYYKRGVALTEARQYASALGDYRRAVKYDAGNTDAKDWIDKIIIIYDGLNKSYPKEGEEPPPLEYKPGS